LDEKAPAVEVEDGQAWITHRSVPGPSTCEWAGLGVRWRSRFRVLSC